MFQILKQTKIDFMKMSRPVLVLSAAVVLVSLGLLFSMGLNYGIEFTGGTELQIKYRDTPDITAIRSALGGADVGTVSVSRIGEEHKNEVWIRVASAPGDAEADDENDPVSAMIRALRGGDVAEYDLNAIDQAHLSNLLASTGGTTREEATIVATNILERRREQAIFHSVAELSDVGGMTPTMLATLTASASVGPFSVRSQSYIGPAIGHELKQKAGLAVLGSLVGMLVYIWIRFQLKWGLAAVIALAHDTVITLGLFSLFGKEMSLPVVAAFLTLVGYSVNDTVVVFDRIRENISKMPTKNLNEVINLAINQTLSRTVITSGLTLAVVVALLVFGGAALNPFAFVLTCGVLVGTYSSIFVAAPILVLGRKLIGKSDLADPGSGAKPPIRRTKKVRATTAG